MRDKMTKTKQVEAYLIAYGSIDSWTAIQSFGATRLSAIIFNPRHKKGMSIRTDTINVKDRNGNSCGFAKYILEKGV